jgi:FkbM family methyltransferase
MSFSRLIGYPLPSLTFIDVGAMNLGSEPYAPLVDQGLGRVIGFEPVIEECNRLNELHRGKGHQYLACAVGDGSTGSFNICNYPMTSSLFQPNTPLVQKFQNLGNLMEVVRSSEIVTRRLDDIPEVAEADYLKMDAQGAELSILCGAAQTLEQVMIVHTEVEFVPLYVGQPLFADVDTELRRQGFSFHRFTGIAGRPFKPFMQNGDPNKSISQQLWADAVYVKDFMRFAELPVSKLLKLAIMLHELYQSYDLCALALEAFDEKTGFGLQKNYCAGVTAQT